jgi:hypothetical protein
VKKKGFAYECDKLWFRGPCSSTVNFEVKSFEMSSISPDIAGKGKVVRVFSQLSTMPSENTGGWSYNSTTYFYLDSRYR